MAIDIWTQVYDYLYNAIVDLVPEGNAISLTSSNPNPYDYGAQDSDYPFIQLEPVSSPAPEYDSSHYFFTQRLVVRGVTLDRSVYDATETVTNFFSLKWALEKALAPILGSTDIAYTTDSDVAFEVVSITQDGDSEEFSNEYAKGTMAWVVEIPLEVKLAVLRADL